MNSNNISPVMTQEALIESFSPQNLADVKQTLAENKKWQPLFRFIMAVMNIVVLLFFILSYDKVPLILSIFIFLSMLFASLLAILFRAGLLLSLERDVKEQKKIIGTFSVVEKKAIYNKRAPNKYILVFNLPEVKDTEVTFEFWNRVKEGDSFFMEKSCHYGMVFTLLYNGVEAKNEVLQ